MIDALIACFVEDFRHKLAMNEYDDVDRTGGFEHISVGDGNQLNYLYIKYFNLICYEQDLKYHWHICSAANHNRDCVIN